VTGLLGRALAALPQAVRDGACAAGRKIALRADAGYFAGELARAAAKEDMAFAIGAKRISSMWKALAGIPDDAWRDAIEMASAQVAVSPYRPADWPEDTPPADRPGITPHPHSPHRHPAPRPRPPGPHPAKGPRATEPGATPGPPSCPHAGRPHPKITYLAVDKIRRSTRGFGSDGVEIPSTAIQHHQFYSVPRLPARLPSRQRVFPSPR
jgi:hypothetical protein